MVFAVVTALNHSTYLVLHGITHGPLCSACDALSRAAADDDDDDDDDDDAGGAGGVRQVPASAS